MEILSRILEDQNLNSRKVYLSEIVFYGKHFFDDNIFFTALIAFTLKSIQHTFDLKSQQKINEILKQSNHAFSFFKNKHGKLTYNFYPTQPVNQYAGIPFLNKFTALQIPDDIDSTSLVYLSKTTNSSEVFKIKQLLESLSYDGKPIESIPKKYRNTKAYRTWFATKMRHDMDICVMCNALIWVHQNDISFSKTDENSIQLISSLIEENKLLKQAYLFAPHYKTPSIVLYHVVRCLDICKHPNLVKHQSKLTNYCLDLLTKINHPFEKVILYTSLSKLNYKIDFELDILNSDFQNFYWFKANPFSVAKPWIKNIFSKKNFLHLQYKCEAYYWVLLLELQQNTNATLHIESTKTRIKSI